MLLLLRLLFSGGMITKIAMIALLLGFISSGTSCAFKSVELGKAHRDVASLTTKNTQLSTDNEVLKQNNATLKDNFNRAANANDKTADANKKLLNERKSALETLNALAKAREVERQRVDAANKKIDEMLKNPENNGPIAPVLRETLRDVQRKTK